MKKTYNKEDIEQITQEQEDELFQMSNIREKRTGLPFVVWVSTKGKAKHSARIKIPIEKSSGLNASNLIPIIIDKTEPTIPKQFENRHEHTNKEINCVKKWIILNYDVLMKHWNEEIDTEDLFEQLKPI